MKSIAGQSISQPRELDLATLRDIANAAGVSVSTVSRVLSGARPVGPEIEGIVRSAAARLDYRPHSVARALRRGATNTVGVVVPHIANPFFPHLVQALERKLQPEGRELFLCDSRNDPALETRRVEALLERKVDALVLVPCHVRKSRAALEVAVQAVRVVQVDRRVAGARSSYVGVDNRSGVEKVVEHLRALGRRRFAFVGAEPITSTARERLQAYQRAVDGSSAKSVFLGDFSAEWGYEAASSIGRADAVVCGNDLVALGMISGLKARGIEVPTDVAVTGFDDVGLVAAWGHPAITTVRQPVDGLAAEVTGLLLRSSPAHDDPPVQRRLDPELVRSSTVGDVR